MDEVTKGLKQNQHNFIKEVFLNHTNIGARLTCYSSKHILIDTSKINLEVDEYKVQIPSNCKYARNDILFIPLFTKKENISKEDLKTLFKPLLCCQKKH